MIGIQRVRPGSGQHRERKAGLVFGHAAGIVHRQRHVVGAVDGDGQRRVGGLAGIAGQRIRHVDGRGFAGVQLLERSPQRDLDFLVGVEGRR